MDSHIQSVLNATSYTPPYTPPSLVRNEEHPHNVLRPPQFSTILGDDDRLQPNPQQLKTATEKCREYWYRLAVMAISQHRYGILPAFANPRNMLGRVPAVHGRLGQTCAFRLGLSLSKALCVQAFSTWGITDNASCGLGNKQKTIPALLQIGTQEPIPCTFGGDSFRRWIGTADEERDMPSYLGILALGWSYILSARLVEIQGEGAKMIYTSSKATGYHQATEHGRAPAATIDIGEVDEDITRWWAAILAPCEGWKAIVSRRDDGEYLAPWSLSREGTLATTVTFPTHSYHGTIVQLPFPSETKAQQKDIPVDPIVPEWITVNEELPYYMALSCNPEVVISSLCGMFWEDDEKEGAGRRASLHADQHGQPGVHLEISGPR